MGRQWTWHAEIDLCEIFEHAHLKLLYMAASKHICKHTTAMQSR